MRIVHIAKTPVANAPWFIAEAINRFTEHESVFISAPNFRFTPHINIISRQNVIKAVSRADVLHCHGNFMLEDPSARYAYILKHIPTRAKILYQAHSSRKEMPLSKLPDKNKYVRRMVVAQGWSRYYPRNWIKVPNIIFTEDMEPIRFVHRKKQVVFTPSNRFNRDRALGELQRAEKPNPKGWRYTINALRGMPLRVFEDLPIDECIRRKADAWLGIDEVATPMYHRSGLEFLALGVACVERFDDISEADLLAVSGADKNPFVRVNSHDALTQTVRTYLADREACRENGKAAREWMMKHWTAKRMVRKYTDIYESL